MTLSLEEYFFNCFFVYKRGAVKCAAARGGVRRGTLNIPESCRGAPAGKAEHGHSVSILWPRASGYAVLGDVRLSRAGMEMTCGQYVWYSGHFLKALFAANYAATFDHSPNEQTNIIPEYQTH
jgi:hypothetical protein